MAERDGRGAAGVAGTILLLVAALNMAYALYRVTQGFELNTAQMAISASAAAVAAILLSRSRKSGS